MVKKFEQQKNEIKKLHKKYESYLRREYDGRDYFCFLSNPNNFGENIFYHQANSTKERNSIIRNGFNENKVKKSNCGAGRGLYLGRDKNALMNFYVDDVNSPQDFTVKITGKFNFFDLLDNQDFLRQNKNNIESKVLSMGYDGIRYYDPDATGEEFVLFNYFKILIEK